MVTKRVKADKPDSNEDLGFLEFSSEDLLCMSYDEFEAKIRTAAKQLMAHKQNQNSGKRPSDT